LALPRLRVRYKQVREQEDIAAWKADAEKLAARRNTLVREFAALLPVELIGHPEHNVRHHWQAASDAGG
jgi:hypothetical protein